MMELKIQFRIYNLTSMLLYIFVFTWFIKDSDSYRILEKPLFFSKRLDQSVAYFTTFGISFLDCIKYCDDRVKCKSVAYGRQRCELHEHGLTDDDGNPAAMQKDMAVVLFERESWRTKTGACGEEMCSGEQTCDTTLTQCAIKECERAEDSAVSQVRGNVLHAGAAIVRICNTGLIYPDGSSRKRLVCASSGLWESGQNMHACEPVTCTNVGISNNPAPAEYESYDLNSQQVIKIFCLYGIGHGYTYISRDYVAHVTDLSRFYTRTDHVMIRHRRSDGSQWEGKFSVFSLYSTLYNVTILANDHTDFTPVTVSEKAAGNGDYIIAGLVPISYGDRYHTRQGYTFEGADVEFINCDRTRSNQFVVCADKPTQTMPETCGSTMLNPACAWINKAYLATYNLPSTYFYWYAIFMGGCGTNINSVTFPDGIAVTGATLGLRFDF